MSDVQFACPCYDVSGESFRALIGQGITDAKKIQELTGAGLGCGMCEDRMFMVIRDEIDAARKHASTRTDTPADKAQPPARGRGTVVKKDVFSHSEEDLIHDCPDIYAFSLLGGKWRLPVIWMLATYGDLRFNELKRRLTGITNIMLTRSLTELEQHGLVVRRDFGEKPLRVEYALTEKSRAILPALNFINVWGLDLIKDLRKAGD